LHEQIAKRLDEMLAGGWAEEVRALQATVSGDAPAWQAAGYGIGAQIGTRRTGTPRDPRRYTYRDAAVAKRQRTCSGPAWRRRVTRIDPHDPQLRGGSRTVWRKETRVKIGITVTRRTADPAAIATELGIALAERGHEVHFITYQLPFRLLVLARFISTKSDVGRIPCFKYPPYDLALRAHARGRDQ